MIESAVAPADALRSARIDPAYCGSSVGGGELEDRPQPAREMSITSPELSRPERSEISPESNFLEQLSSRVRRSRPFPASFRSRTQNFDHNDVQIATRIHIMCSEESRPRLALALHQGRVFAGSWLESSCSIWLA